MVAATEYFHHCRKHCSRKLNGEHFAKYSGARDCVGGILSEGYFCRLFENGISKKGRFIRDDTQLLQDIEHDTLT